MSTPSRKKRSDALTPEEREQRRKESQKKYRASAKGKAVIKKHRVKEYGITPDEWDAMFSQQHHKCAICGGDDPQKSGQDWSTDHCHATGKVRGILCHPCNLMLGYARDNSHTLAKAIDYLEKHNG